MAVDTSILPYFDDYDKNKGFSKILFRPERSVQVRELNQIQSLLQSQISRFGDSIYEDGSVVVPGEVTYDLKYSYAKLNLNGSYSDFAPLINTVGSFAVGQTSLVSADIKQIAPVDDTDPVTLFIKYKDSGVSSESKTFAAETIDIFALTNNDGVIVSVSNVTGQFAIGETITGGTSGALGTVSAYVMGSLYVSVYSGTFVSSETLTGGTSSAVATAGVIEATKLPAKLVDATVTETGFGSAANVKPGVYYVNGQFAYVLGQTLILDRYDVAPSYRIGFDITESIVTFQEDTTLLDNSNGSPNYTAPGADRLKLELILSKREIGTSDDQDFLEVMRLDAGELLSKARGPSYSVIGDTMARRTHDESGDYVVDNFDISIHEHLKDGDNGGIFDVAGGGLESNIAIGLEKGKAYVRGYEIETLSSTYVKADKARDVDTINNSVSYMSYGTFVYITNANVIPQFSNFETVELYAGGVGADGEQPAGALLGTARVRNIEYSSGVISTQADAVFKMYLFDVRDTGGVKNGSIVNNAGSIYQASSSFTSDLSGTAQLREVAGSSLVFNLPASGISTLSPVGGLDTNYSVSRMYETSTDTNGDVLLNAGTNEVFSSYTANDYLLSILNDGTIEDLSGKVVLGGTPVGKSLTISLGAPNASKSVRLVVTVIKQQSTHKAKTVTTTSEAGSLINNVFRLAKADVFEIVSVVDDTTSIDITENFELVTGKNENFYDLSSVRKKNWAPSPVGTITVSFKYFTHGPGDYFSVDSYAGVSYSDIPSEKINGVDVRLSDVVDFRPRIGDNGTSFATVGSSIGNVPKNSTYFRSDFDYYLNRIDVLYLNSEGIFDVVKGEPAVIPTAPSAPDNSMVLYVLEIPAYTFNPSDVVVNTIDNRRYTMRDIGKLETRIENLEYYTALNALESQTSEMKVLDDAGNDRFKNGFMVDRFIDHTVGDSSRNDYLCSIDGYEGLLRPMCDMNGLDVELGGASSNFAINDNIVTLPFTEKTFINQPYATSTMNVNPYAVFAWNGSVKLTPNKDTWVDTKYTNPIIVNQTKTVNKYVNKTVNRTVNLNNTIDSFFNWNFSWNSWNWGWTGSSATSSTSSTNKTTSTSFSNKVTSDNVVARSSIPYIRSKAVEFVGVGFKPFTKVYPFFDDTNVSVYCKPKTGNYGDSLFTDGAGKVEGVFNIPNTSTLRFKTGQRVFMLTDRTDGDALFAQTDGSSVYTASGVLDTRQKNILSTRTINNTFTTTTTITSVPRIRWSDPLAQSFLVESSGGLFLNSVDIWVNTKDPSIPLSVEIREMDNGYPSQTLVPGGRVMLEPSDINISTDGINNSTKVTFPHPIYLNNGGEYCFVLKSDSIKYNVWIARMGEQIVGTKSYVSKQPYIGVMFKSQNDSTWTAAQNEDIKFKLNRCLFDTAQQPVIHLNNKDLESVVLPSNPVLVENASNTATVYIKNHSMFVGSKFTLSGVVAGLGVTSGMINKTHTVVSVEGPDSVTITLTGAATGSGFMGGDVATSSVNFLYNQIKPNVNEMVLDGTSVSWAVTGVTGKSIGGTETPFVTKTQSYCVNKNDISFNEPRCVLSADDETANNSANKSFSIIGTMSSTKDNISPVIDLEGSSVIVVGNRVNNDTANETDAFGGNSLFRYVTKPSSLKLSANSLKTFLDVNRPQGSAVTVYYKTGVSEAELIESDWIELTGISVNGESDDGMFYENEYGVDNIADFTHYMIKIVGVSANSSNVPQCKNLRAIALGT